MTQVRVVVDGRTYRLLHGKVSSMEDGRGTGLFDRNTLRFVRESGRVGLSY